ncbi:MAG: carboxyvinyl-carboxyphosphonate phosphorylmutase [Bacteroidetes bacterium]|nr:carboxyvinyl-carboxyphosphonate phosphorylmutase [Bacteroidota bacterium]
MGDRRLRDLLASGEAIIAPGVYDMISARMACQAGFNALYVGGYGISASHLGLPDVGLMSYTDVVQQVRSIVRNSTIPVIADADTGYGGLVNLRLTVRGFEDAGASAIQIEDQNFPKRFAHAKGVQVITKAEMVRKVKVACDSRSSEDFLIIARTDSLPEHGVDDAVDRATAYVEAGADIVFIEGAQDAAGMRHIAGQFSVPLVAKMFPDGEIGALSSAALAEMGYQVIIYPALGFLAASAALEAGYAEFLDTGKVTHQPLFGFEEFSQMIGFEEIYEFEKRWDEE